MSECINLSVSLRIRHLSLKLLSAIEISGTRLFILACSSCQQFNVKAPLCKHFLHKVVNNVHLNKSSVQQSRHLAFIPRVCCITTAASVVLTLPPQNGAYPLPGFSFFIGPKFDGHHGNQGSHGTLPGPGPRSLQGGTSSALVPISVMSPRQADTTWFFVLFFARNSWPQWECQPANLL